MPDQTGVFALIGDLVASRRADSRLALHTSLSLALETVSLEVPCLQRLSPTVGDEFQGVFEDFSKAARATLLVRLLLLPNSDVRIGIGYGDVQIIDARREPVIQDGSAWWNARGALETLGTKSRRDRRTWLVSADRQISGSQTMSPSNVVNAHLTCRDALIDRLGGNGRRILLGSLRGQTQASLSQDLHITQGAISQQFARGVSAVRDAQLLLEGVS